MFRATGVARAVVSMIEQAMTAADEAEAVGQNARQMVLNRDPRLDTLAARVTELEARSLAVGVAAVPAIALNGSVDITVALDQTMPSTTYRAHVIRPAGLLPITTVTVKSQTTSTVVVTVKALAVVTVGQALTVIAS